MFVTVCGIALLTAAGNEKSDVEARWVGRLFKRTRTRKIADDESR